MTHHDRVIPGQPTTFEEAFPTVAEVRIEVSEWDRPENDTISRVFTRANFPGAGVKCLNPGCSSDAMVDLVPILEAMARGGETERTISGACPGYVGSPKGRRIRGPCYKTYGGSVSITYKP